MTQELCEWEVAELVDGLVPLSKNFLNLLLVVGFGHSECKALEQVAWGESQTALIESFEENVGVIF